jgi:hypothetical protein
LYQVKGRSADDYQIQEHCLKNQGTIDNCKLFNLGCVCKTSSDISNNTYFDQNCLFNDCYNELGRRGQSLRKHFTTTAG